MDQIKTQVRRARRRLLYERFLRTLPWRLFATLLVATVAIAVPRLFPLAVHSQIWIQAWIGGAVAAGLLGAAVWSYLTSADELGAAIEVDLRYNLKERVSSTLALSPSELETEAGRALAEDAARSIDRVDVSQRFRVTPTRSVWLPLVPAMIAFCLVLFVDEVGSTNPAEATTTTASKKQIKKSTDQLRKKIAERRKKAEEKGLKDAESIFKKLEQGTRKLNEEKDVDRKKAMVKLNDLAKQLENRVKQMGGSEKLQQHLKQLKNISKGPADQLADALKQGDVSKAMKALDELRDKIKSGELSDKQKAELGKQLEELKENLQRIADAHKQAMENVKRELEQARKAGDTEQASKLQKQLDKLAQQAPQIDKLNQLSNKLGECSDCMSQGDGQGAMNALAELADDLEGLQERLDELAMLEGALDQIDECKDAMACKMCQGAGCGACQGNGFGDGRFGLGEGRGQGARPEEKTKTGSYKSRVRQKPGQGKAVITDFVDGPNAKGQVVEQIKAETGASDQQLADPQINRKLPRAHQEHAKEFFEAFREGT